MSNVAVLVAHNVPVDTHATLDEAQASNTWTSGVRCSLSYVYTTMETYQHMA